MTGTVQNSPTQVIQNMTSDALQLTFVNSEGAALKAGQEVKLHTDGTIKLRKLQTDSCLGVVMKGAEDGARATIRIAAHVTLLGVAKGGTLTAGTLVYPDGTVNADGYPSYLTSTKANGNISQAIVLRGATVTNKVLIGILQAPVPVPADVV